MHVIGLISGTSVDGIDAALVEVSGTTKDLTIELIRGATYPYPAELRDQILAVCHGQPLSMEHLAALDDAIAQVFATAALRIQDGHFPAHLIGSHGQTVYHRPPSRPLLNPVPVNGLGYSQQLGRGDLIAHLTQIPTVSNFRAADIALGGQGAPLVSALDVCLLGHPTQHRCIQNIGGIGNVTFLPPQSQVDADLKIRGWDTGPGNTLLDFAVQQISHGKQAYDKDGAWASSGVPCRELVQQWLEDDFFGQPPPKSTGREKFGAAYAQQCLAETRARGLSDADTLATLTELTAVSIELSYRQFLPHMPDQAIVCGGGSRNRYLMQRLQAVLSPTDVFTSDAVGLSAEYKEAIAFALLAYWRWHGIPGNVPAVTGAMRSVPLGDLHLTAPYSDDTMR